MTFYIEAHWNTWTTGTAALAISSLLNKRSAICCVLSLSTMRMESQLIAHWSTGKLLHSQEVMLFLNEQHHKHLTRRKLITYSTTSSVTIWFIFEKKKKQKKKLKAVFFRFLQMKLLCHSYKGCWQRHHSSLATDHLWKCRSWPQPQTLALGAPGRL